jgi:TonB family protein
MTMKRISLVVCTLILLVAGAYAQTTIPSESLRWETYTIKGEDFAVELPVLPAMHTTEQYLRRLDRFRKIHLLGSYADGVVYTITVFENPQPRQSLNDFVKEQLQKAWDRKTARDLTLDGFTGKAISSADRADGMVQYFATEDRLYTFMAFGAPEDDPRLKKFFSSFSLRRKKHSKELVEGPGEAYIPKGESAASNWAAAFEKLFVGKDVNKKVRLAMKPEPVYTEVARQNGIKGTVVLKCIFASNGIVTNIRIVSGLPFGLTESAIDAAKKIKFLPAVKDGQYVSMWMQLEYNFNLY